jgi:hypothetical protein
MPCYSAKRKNPGQIYFILILQAGYDIRVIQTLLGYSSLFLINRISALTKLFSADKTQKIASIALKTTMIYTHCVPVRTVKELKKPLDLRT